MELILRKQKLPKNKQYVLAYFPGRPWNDSDVGNNEHKWVVVKFVRGLSCAERASLSDTDGRKSLFRSEDEDGNNQVPYYWDTFGPDSFYGQEAECWCELPKL